jgi:hypothetical protein
MNWPAARWDDFICVKCVGITNPDCACVVANPVVAFVVKSRGNYGGGGNERARTRDSSIG